MVTDQSINPTLWREMVVDGPAVFDCSMTNTAEISESLWPGAINLGLWLMVYWYPANQRSREKPSVNHTQLCSSASLVQLTKDMFGNNSSNHARNDRCMGLAGRRHSDMMSLIDDICWRSFSIVSDVMLYQNWWHWSSETAFRCVWMTVPGEPVGGCVLTTKRETIRHLDSRWQRVAAWLPQFSRPGSDSPTGCTWPGCNQPTT